LFGRIFFLFIFIFHLKTTSNTYYDFDTIRKHTRPINENKPVAIILNRIAALKAILVGIPYYDATSLLLPFLTVPLYYLAVITSSNPINVVAFFSNSIILSLVSVLIFLTGLHFFQSKRISFVLSLVFLVTTFVWSYNTGMMLRPLAALFALVGFYLIINSKYDDNYRPLISGICIGLVLLSSASAIIILPGFVAFGIFNFRKNRKQLFFFLIGFSIIMLTQVWLNDIRFGSYSDFGFGFQQDITTHSHIEGVIGYIFSLGWGLPFNSPLLIFFPFAVYIIMKKNLPLAIFLLYLFMITWLFHGTEQEPHWSGYGGWGPRYFTMILPFLILSLGFLIEKFSTNIKFKISFIVLAVFGFFVGLMGKLVWYFYGYGYGWQVLKYHLKENWFELLNYDINYAPITLHLQTLLTDFIPHGINPLNTEFARGLAPCSYDLYIYCEIGILPFIGILILLTTVGFLLLKKLKINPKENLNINT